MSGTASGRAGPARLVCRRRTEARPSARPPRSRPAHLPGRRPDAAPIPLLGARRLPGSWTGSKSFLASAYTYVERGCAPDLTRTAAGSPRRLALLVSFLSASLPRPFVLLFEAVLFSKYLYLFCSVIRKGNPGESSLLPSAVALGCPRVPACVARSEGPGPCLPACPPAPHPATGVP